MLTANEICNALEGVVYLTDRQGNLLMRSEPSWSNFAKENGAPKLISKADLNSRLACDGDETKAAYEALYDALWIGEIERHVIPFRCDSASFRREFRLALSRVTLGGTTQAILHQSLPISETIRPPLDIFDPVARRRALGNGPLVRICSYCLKIFDIQDGTWIEADEYYRRGGISEVRLSHGICGDCEHLVLGTVKSRPQLRERH